MRTLTPAEREQCNLVAINCTLKRSRWPGSLPCPQQQHTDMKVKVGEPAGLEWSQLCGPCFGDKSPPLVDDLFGNMRVWLSPPPFSGTTGRRHVRLAREKDRRAELAGRQTGRQAGRQAGRHSSSLTTGN